MPDEVKTVDAPTEQSAEQLNTDEKKTLTQEEVNAIIRDRLQRERDKYKDYDALKTAAAKYAEIEEAKKSELQKAQEKANEWKAKYDAAMSVGITITKRTAVQMQAIKLGMDSELAEKLVDLETIEVDDKGAVTNAEAALNALLKKWPQLAKPATEEPAQPTAPNKALDAKAGGSGKAQSPKMSEAEVREWAAKFNLTADDVRGELSRQGRI